MIITAVDLRASICQNLKRLQKCYSSLRIHTKRFILPTDLGIRLLASGVPLEKRNFKRM